MNNKMKSINMIPSTRILIRLNCEKFKKIAVKYENVNQFIDEYNVFVENHKHEIITEQTINDFLDKCSNYGIQIDIIKLNNDYTIYF